MTIADDLRREFRHSAECGFAIANEERIEGVVCIAAGVNGLKG
jgi:DNA-binding IclR family transcriptional regulator